LSPQPSSSDVGINGINGDNDNANTNAIDYVSLPTPPTPAKRKMDIMWCGKDYCKDAVRERVVGDHNQILLNGPATGQVAYYWNNHENAGSNSGSNGSNSSSALKTANAPTETAAPSVLLLVKPGDPELLEIAAAAVMQLTQGHPKVDILLDPSTAAKLKHYHGVESEQIHLFEATPTPGFGDNLRPDDVLDRLDPWNWSDPELPQLKQSPDLICTLGGDGLLMHAGMMFQGPVPPILCVSGGSLGFLTPFQNHEMVEAVRLALGLVQSQAAGTGATDFFTDIDVFPPNMPTDPYEPPLSALTPQHTPDTLKPPRFAFGLGGRICLSIRMRLECRVLNREGTVRARYNVLNEVVIDRGSSPYLAALECFCDDVHLTTVQADGVIFATPTGSTAYSMAAGGSVVHPAVPCILVTPICPHVLSFRSMVFPDHVVLDVYVPDDARSEASVSFDGKFRQDLRRGDCVEISMSPYAVPTVNRFDHSTDWLGSLKRNFNFNARPRQKPL
jgi:NAD+ kinase